MQNLTKAKPLFRRHYLPHLPADLGFYRTNISRHLIRLGLLSDIYLKAVSNHLNQAGLLTS